MPHDSSLDNSLVNFRSTLAALVDGAAKVLGPGRDATNLKKIADDVRRCAARVEQLAKRRVRYERLIAELTQVAIKRQPLKDFLETVTRRLGEALDVCRAYVFEFDAGRQNVVNTHEWLSKGAKSLGDFKPETTVEAQYWASGQLLGGKVIALDDVSKCPSKEFSKMILKSGAKSVLVVPIFTFGNPFGFIGFDVCNKIHHWEKIDIELLESIARIIAQSIERHRLETEVVHAELLAATGRLAATVAHEINNPLQTITLHLDELKFHLPKGCKRNFKYVSESVGRISYIVTRLLNLSRKYKKIERIDINHEIKYVTKMLEKQLIMKGCVVNEKFAPKLPTVTGDVERLHQVFINVMINACDSMSGGGVLSVATFRRKEWVVVSISDTGVGIDEAKLPYLFEPFFSTKGATGTGLGLFVSNAIVSDHGGKIEVESKKGKGTTMRILLPKI